MTREEAIHRMELFAINITGAAAKGNPLAIKDLDAVNMAIEALQERPKGKLVEFPYHAYCIMDDKVYKGWVQRVEYAVARKPIFEVRYDDKSLEYHRGYVGLTVFLTKEEAEKALADMRESE